MANYKERIQAGLAKEIAARERQKEKVRVTKQMPPQPLPVNTQKLSVKANSGGKNKASGVSAIPVNNKRQGQATLGEAGLEAFEKSQAEYVAPRLIRNAAEGYINNSITGTLHKMATGKNLTDEINSRNPYNEQLHEGAAAGIGQFVGSGTAFMSQSGLAAPLTGKAAKAAAGTKLGKAVSGKIGKGLTEGLAENAIDALTVGLAQNVGMGFGDGLRGKELLKDVAFSTGADLALGTGLELLFSDTKALKKLKKPERIPDAANAKTAAEPAAPGEKLGSTEYTDQLARTSRSLYGEKENKYLEPVGTGKMATPVDASADISVKGQKKAEAYQKRANKDFTRKVADSLGISKYGDTRRIREMVEEATEKVKDGTFTDADKEKLFDEMFAEGVMVDESFVKQYANLKQTIRNTQLHLTDDIKNNITDFNNFRQSNLNTVRLSNDTGAEIDIFYDELRSAYPELFPELNTPAEMLKKISEVAKSIKKTETRLADIAGEDWDLVFEESRAAFDKAFSELENQSNIVKQYLTSKNPVSVEETKARIEDIKIMRREVDQLKSKLLLSDYEREMVDLLHQGRWNEAMVRTADPLGADNVMSLYNAEKPLREAEKALKATGEATKQSYRDMAADALQGSELWHDKALGFMYGRETAERNAVDIAGKEAGGKLADMFFKPVHEHEAMATRMKNDLRQAVKGLNISTKPKYDISKEVFDAPGLSEELRNAQAKGNEYKVSESTLVQLYGEKLIDEEMLARIGADVDKITGAVEEMRTIYNQLFDAANAELVRHGYEPIEFRQDYFPHFTEDKPDGLLAKAANALGFNILRDELPMDIAGLTHTFKPGKTWFGHILQRTTKETEYDAVKGFDIYLEGISDIIHHTEDIQMLRALETEARYKHGSEGVKLMIDDLRNRTDFSESQKDAYMETILEKGNTQLGHFVTWLRGYTDNLAGKKSQIDRTFEYNIGRGIYNTSKAIESRVAANMVALNPGSWLTNFIPLVQGSEVKNSNIIKGMAETIGNHIRRDNIGEMSTFLTNRRGSDVLWKSNVERVQDFLTKPMQVIDDFVSESLVRARYLEEVGKGADPVSAMKTADEFAANVIADRSKGALPTVFNAKNPISKIFTMYQVEVNNQWSHLFKDIPRTKENVAAITLAITKFAVGAYIFNDVYESIVGRRPALDPLSWANDFMGDMTGKKVKNFVEALMDEEEGILEETKKKDLTAATTRLLKDNVAESIPFVGGIAGGGRVPLQSALPEAGTVLKSLAEIGSGDATMKAWADLGSELAKPAAYILPPVGGGQAKKVAETALNYYRGGSMAWNKDGEQELRFATDREFWPMARDLAFGQYSGKNAQNYVESGFKMLSVKKTKAFESLVESGVKPTEAENFLRGLPEKKADIKTAIMNSGYTAEQKNAIGRALWPDEKPIDFTTKSSYAYSALPESSQKKVKSLQSAGLTQKRALDAYEVQKKYDSDLEKAYALMQEEYYKEAVLKALEISENTAAKAEALSNAGVSLDTYQMAKILADKDFSGGVSKKEAEAYFKTRDFSRKEKYALMKALTQVKDKNNPYR